MSRPCSQAAANPGSPCRSRQPPSRLSRPWARAACDQGRDLGFDGKTLIHPRQIEPANRVFGISEEALQQAQRIITAWRAAQQAGSGVCVVAGRLVEHLHVEEAKRVLAMHRAIHERA